MMLILTRRCNEELVVDHRVSLRVVEISGGRVKVAVKAPAEVPVRRVEQLDRFALDCGPVLVAETEAVGA